MAKRFLDSDIFKKPFIKSLEAPFKLLWFYIISDCNHAGLWDVEIDVAQLKIGVKIDEKKAIKGFGDKIMVINDGKKWFIPSFIDFQYGTLNPENRSHAAAIKLLLPLNICSLDGKIIKPLTSPLQAPSNGAMDMDKDKDMVKEGGVGETKNQKKKVFEPPTVEQVVEYFKENGFNETGAKKAHEHYRLANWHDTNGKPVLAWKQKVHTNWFKDEFRIMGFIKKLLPKERPPQPDPLAEWNEEKQMWYVDHNKFMGT